MYLIKNIHVYTPEDVGIKDVLISDKIEKIEDSIDSELFDIIDGTGKSLVPGFIDGHVHITGGGGEGGYATKTPEITLSSITKYGVTTVLGLLGTDGMSRNVENLLSKVKALRTEGISAYGLTGSYSYPSCTITGDLQKDIMFIDEIIGLKLALSDHRGSYFSKQQLTEIAAQVRLAGMLSGKAGIIVLHMGNDKTGLQMVFDILKETSLPVTLFHPTHVGRNPVLLGQGYEFAEMGGYIDFTADEHCGASECILKAIEKGISTNRMTISSDGQGSWSTYDDEGNLLEIGYSTMQEEWNEFLYLTQMLSLSGSLPFFTRNVAEALKLKQKGEVKVGKDADLLILNEDNTIDTVIAMGKVHVSKGETVIKGTYE